MVVSSISLHTCLSKTINSCQQKYVTIDCVAQRLNYFANDSEHLWLCLQPHSPVNVNQYLALIRLFVVMFYFYTINYGMFTEVASIY